MARGGLVQARTALRDQGVLAHLGVVGGPVRLMREFIATGQFDAVLSHNRFTLVDRSAGPLMGDTRQRGVAFVNGAPYGGGMLAKGPDVQPKYAYRPAGEAVQGAVRAMQRACAAHGVSLAAAALQFSLRDPRVASTVVGVSEPSRIGEIAALMSEQIPAELWAELDSLSVAPEFWLN
jgi:D-threo-aldose 1-dehydrogenase